jgi:DNA-binding response OmpR family regulator
MTETGPRALRRRVLIVEDEAPIRELMRLHLGLAGFDVVECGTGTAGLERARAEKFDLILLDVMLPGLDGITVCRAIRNQGANTNTAILMVTARDTESDTVLGLESGADDYLAKPFGVRELVARTAALLRRTGRQDGAPAASPEASSRAIWRSMPTAAKRSCAARPSNSPSRNSICSICSPRAEASCSAGRRCSRKSGTATPT